MISFAEFNVPTLYILANQVLFRSYVLRHIRLRPRLRSRGVGGVLPYMGYIGMCRCEGYGFQAFYSRIGYITQRVRVQNRVSFFRKLISWLKILSRLGKQLL